MDSGMDVGVEAGGRLGVEAARLVFDAPAAGALFGRSPFGFAHNLHRLDLFAPDALMDLAQRCEAVPRDTYVAASAPAPGSGFYSMPEPLRGATAALRVLDYVPARILLKRPENHHPGFRALLDMLFEQLAALAPALRGAIPVRLEATVLISSAAATTPFHFDPEVNLFCQIEGPKTYHVYAPQMLDEPVLERFYVRDVVDICQAELEAADPACEHVFELAPGRGLHHPANAAHWVQTADSRSVSYSFVVVTQAERALGRTRACNHYLRRLGLQPGRPGTAPALDAVKAQAMRAVIPLRRALVRR